MSSHASATVLRQCYVAACAGDTVGVMNVLREVCGADHAAAMIWWRVDGRWHWAASRGARSADVLLHAVRGDGVDAWPMADAEVRGAVWLEYRKQGVPRLGQHRAAPRALLPHFAQALPLCWQRAAARAGLPSVRPVQPAVPWLTDAFHLTRREVDVADLLARGSDPACIARTLGISLDTVRTHLKHVYRKTNTHSQCDVVRLMLALSARS